LVDAEDQICCQIWEVLEINRLYLTFARNRKINPRPAIGLIYTEFNS